MNVTTANKVAAVKEVVATIAVVVVVGVSAGNSVSLNVDCKQACWDAITVRGIDDGHDSKKHSGNVTQCCHSRHA